jgi:hypothetical protein
MRKNVSNLLLIGALVVILSFVITGCASPTTEPTEEPAAVEPSEEEEHPEDEHAEATNGGPWRPVMSMTMKAVPMHQKVINHYGRPNPPMNEVDQIPGVVKNATVGTIKALKALIVPDPTLPALWVCFS